MQPHIKTLVISSIVTLFILASFASASTEDGTSFFPKIGGQNQSAQLANIPDSTSGDSEGGILSGILNFFGNLFFHIYEGYIFSTDLTVIIYYNLLFIIIIIIIIIINQNE